MRNMLKPSSRGLLVVALLAAGAASALAQQAQVRNARVLTARAGVVNFVAGAVEFNREGSAAWRQLSENDELRSGDVVRSGASGHAEVLLNPGSYFRLGGSSEFELSDSSLDSLRLRLTRGSAVVEATGYHGLDLSIVIETPQTRVELIRTGVYRVNVTPAGVTEVAVWDGRARVGRRGEALVRGGRAASVAAGAEPSVAKFDKKNRDALDLWSRERGKELAKLNERFSRREVRTAFSGLDLFDAGYRFGGVWVAYGGCYTFLPYTAYWRSPYGYGYGSWYYTPRAFCMQCPATRGGGSVVGGGGAVLGSGGAFPASGGGGSRRYPSGGGESGPASTPSRPETVFPRPAPETRQTMPADRPAPSRSPGRARMQDQ